MEELWHFNVHVGLSCIAIQRAFSVAASTTSRSLADVHPQTVGTFLVVNLRMSKQRRVASSVANRKLPDRVPTGAVTRLSVTALLLHVSRGSEEPGLGGKVSVPVWEFPSARPNLLVSC